MPIAAGRSADRRLQVVTDGLQTTWSISPQVGSGWEPWQPFPAPAASDDLQLPAWEVTMTQLRAVTPDPEVHGNTGRLQLWGLFFNATQTSSQPSRVYSTIKSSEHPNAPWGPWEDFKLPVLPGPVQGTIAVAYDMAVAQLPDGRLQFWASFVSTAAGQSIWSTVQTGTHWNDPWTPWHHFSLPGDPGYMNQLAAVLLPNGNTQLWALGDHVTTGGLPVDPYPANPFPWTVYSTIRLASAGTVANPLAGWSPWKPFKLSDGPPLNGQGLQTARDGAGRAYLWVERTGPPVQWGYAYSNTGPTANSVAPTWSSLQNMGFPVPAPAQNNPVIDGGEAALSAAELSDGTLQLFYYPRTPQGDPPTQVSSRQQQPGQPPTTWTPWQTPF